MAFTDQCDIFASIHERSFNNLVLQLQRQRPSLFNFGTDSFAAHPQLMCNQTIIKRVDPEVRAYGNPIVNEQPLLAIPGYTGPLGLEYCLQLTELSIDFHPGNVHTLPAQLTPPLATQHLSIKGRACAGLACPGLDILAKLSPRERAFLPVTHAAGTPGREPSHERPRDREGPVVVSTPPRPFPFERESVLCFCLDLFAVLHVERETSSTGQVVTLKLDNLELVDVQPDPLESAGECYLKATFVLGVLPKVKFALEALVFNVADVLTIGPTPLSAAVPFNPAIEGDQIKAFVTLTV
jgi:hypothetical protein